MLRHELREGNWRQLSSCRLLRYGLVSRFSTSRPIIFSGAIPHLARPTAHSPPPQLRPPQNTTGFISLASHLQSSLPEQIVRIGALNLIEINLPTDFNTNLLMLFRWLDRKSTRLNSSHRC